MRLSDAEISSVILINLLPHREAARKRLKEAFYAALLASALLGLAVSGLVYFWYQTSIANQQSRNTTLDSENKRLDGQIKDIASLQSEITALKARQQAVEDLQADRNLPVHLLNELVKQLPSGVYISTLKQENQNITLQGVAQSNERVSELLRNLLNNSPWLSKPDLVEIVAGTVNLSPKDQRRVANFTIKAGLIRASEVAVRAASAATEASAVSSASTPLKAASGQ
jgi:type IV pilus assembly protein PilN